MNDIYTEYEYEELCEQKKKALKTYICPKCGKDAVINTNFSCGKDRFKSKGCDYCEYTGRVNEEKYFTFKKGKN